MNKKKIVERILEKGISIFEYKAKFSLNIRKDFYNKKDAELAAEIIKFALENYQK